MQSTPKYTYPNTKRFLAIVAIVALSFAWVWLLDLLQIEGTVREFALYFPAAIFLVWTWAKVWRPRKSS
jgi:hypothetical protein